MLATDWSAPIATGVASNVHDMFYSHHVIATEHLSTDSLGYNVNVQPSLGASCHGSCIYSPESFIVSLESSSDSAAICLMSACSFGLNGGLS